jgi:hypothetical protein
VKCLRLARLIAERDYYAAMAAELTEEIEADRAAQAAIQINLTQFNPAWKKGKRLTKPVGQDAILAAYDRDMRQVDVSELFRISESAANHWHQRWKDRRQNGTHL